MIQPFLADMGVETLVLRQCACTTKESSYTFALACSVLYYGVDLPILALSTWTSIQIVFLDFKHT